MTADPKTSLNLLQFHKRQGDVPAREAMLAWNPGAFAIVRHPSEPFEWETLSLTNTHGACWDGWSRDESGALRSGRALLSMLNAEVLAILLRGEADPLLARDALNHVPEWRATFGERAPWPFKPFA